jgi:uncharacterized peroxidase-related enzyme
MTTASSNADPQALAAQRAAPSSTNLPLVEEASASPEVRALFQQYRDHFGRTNLPGILLCFATHPPMLRGMLEIAEHLLFVDGLLTRRHKEMIATFLSLQNACPYCADSHGYFLRTQGGSADLLSALRTADLDSPLLTEAERALLRFAARVNTDSQAITRSDIETTMQAGWAETQLAEAVHIAALFAAFNRIANAFGLASPYPGLL